LGAGLTAFATGLSRDLLASYLPGFFAAGLLCLAAALSLCLAKRQHGAMIAASRPA